MTSIVLLIGNPRRDSRTLHVAQALAAAAVEGSSNNENTVDIAVLELADLVGLSFTDDAVAPAAPDAEALGKVLSADLLLVATPSYKGSYTGLLKIFLDRLDADSLVGTTAVPVVIAGSPTHVEWTGSDLQRLLGVLGASTTATIGVQERELGDIALIAATHAATMAAALDTVTATSPEHHLNGTGLT